MFRICSAIFRIFSNVQNFQNLFRIFSNVQNLFSNFQNLFRIFSNVQNLFRIFSNVQNLFSNFQNFQNLFRIFSNVQNLFRIFSNFQNFQILFRISSTKTCLCMYLCVMDILPLSTILIFDFDTSFYSKQITVTNMLLHVSMQIEQNSHEPWAIVGTCWESDNLLEHYRFAKD